MYRNDWQHYCIGCIHWDEINEECTLCMREQRNEGTA